MTLIKLVVVFIHNFYKIVFVFVLSPDTSLFWLSVTSYIPRLIFHLSFFRFNLLISLFLFFRGPSLFSLKIVLLDFSFLYSNLIIWIFLKIVQSCIICLFNTILDWSSMIFSLSLFPILYFIINHVYYNNTMNRT
jgi:hypothetical protein